MIAYRHLQPFLFIVWYNIAYWKRRGLLWNLRFGDYLRSNISKLHIQSILKKNNLPIVFKLQGAEYMISKSSFKPHRMGFHLQSFITYSQ